MKNRNREKKFLGAYSETKGKGWKHLHIGGLEWHWRYRGSDYISLVDPTKQQMKLFLSDLLGDSYHVDYQVVLTPALVKSYIVENLLKDGKLDESKIKRTPDFIFL